MRTLHSVKVRNEAADANGVRLVVRESLREVMLFEAGFSVEDKGQGD